MCEDPPCQKGCSAGVDIKKFIRALKNRNLRGAVSAIRDSNFLVASCGRVCPQTELCEKRCSATGLTKPIAIGELQRFVGETAIKEHFRPVFPEPRSRGEVAIVGAGPAGLAAAFYLRQKGVVADIYEKRTQIGGIPAFGIPRFRLPRDVFNAEVAFVNEAGIQVFHQEVRDLDALCARYRAVFLSCGLGPARNLNLPGEQLDGVVNADTLLEQVNIGETLPRFGGVTVVLGGGNSAMDAASVAIRLGATKVFLAYRRTEVEMPAWLEHRRFVAEEGVELLFLLLPVEILGTDGHVTGVKFQQACLGAPDASGRCQPVPVADAFRVVDCQQVIVALGNDTNDAWRTWGLATEQNGPRVNLKTMETSRPGVFAGGDLVRSGGTVVQAVADGRCAAQAIEQFLAA